MPFSLNTTAALTILTLALSAASATAPARADNDINGILSVQQSFSAIDHKGRVLNLVAGTMARLNYDPETKNNVVNELKLNLKDFEKGDDRQIKIKLPAGVFVPTIAGSFQIVGSAIGQPFDLIGTVSLIEQDSAPTVVNEACMRQLPFERDCRSVKRWDARLRREVTDRVCETGMTSLMGRRPKTVHQHVTTTDQSLLFFASGAIEQINNPIAQPAPIVNPDGSTAVAPAVTPPAPLAIFQGRRSSSREVFDRYDGGCY